MNTKSFRVAQSPWINKNRVRVLDKTAHHEPRQASNRVLQGPPTVIQAWSVLPAENSTVRPERPTQPLKATVWVRALNTLGLVLRNAVGSVACAWIPNACYSLGNIFSGKWYTKQSRSDLIVANSVWDGITFCTVILLSFIPIMLSFRYIGAPDHRPTLVFCIKRLVTATAGHFTAATSVMFSFSYLFAYLSKVQPHIFEYKVDCYVDIVALLVYFTGITRAVKAIYYGETCQGQDRLRQPQLGTSTRPSGSRRRSAPKFWRAYIKNLHLISAPIVASLFVHILSRQRIVDSDNVVLTCFVAGTIIFKLAIQEGAKHYVFKKRVRSVRTMCVLVGIPTVLIDTQTRIVLLGTNNTTTASFGAVGMALVEVSLRATKAMILMWTIKRRRSKLLSQQPTLAPQEMPRLPDQHDVKRTSSLFLSMVTKSSSLTMTKVDFDEWSRQIHAFHTAELNADMYAEYIAIGCSASILFFCGNHPCYSLLRQSKESDMVAREKSQLYMLLLQVVIEFVVDYVSLVIEMTIGVEFVHIKKLGSFLPALFMITAAMNINISINIYLS